MGKPEVRTPASWNYLMKPGDLVKAKNSNTYGTYIGTRTFKYTGTGPGKDYTCAEVMWFTKRAPNGDIVSTIQSDLLEVVNESNTN